MQTWITRHKANSSSCMEIWNLKSGSNMYSEFENKFGALFEVYFKHTLYRFEAWELKSPKLPTVCKSKLE